MNATVMGDTESQPTGAFNGGETLMAEVVEPTGGNGAVDGTEMLLGPTIIRDPRVQEKPREVRTGSPFSGGNVGAASVAPVAKKANVITVQRTPTSDNTWQSVLTDAAPYGSIPLAIYGLIAMWTTGKPSTQTTIYLPYLAIFSSFLATGFALPGLLGAKWKWCIGSLVLATIAVVLAVLR